MATFAHPTTVFGELGGIMSSYIPNARPLWHIIDPYIYPTPPFSQFGLFLSMGTLIAALHYRPKVRSPCIPDGIHIRQVKPVQPQNIYPYGANTLYLHFGKVG